MISFFTWSEFDKSVEEIAEKKKGLSKTKIKGE